MALKIPKWQINAHMGCRCLLRYIVNYKTNKFWEHPVYGTGTGTGWELSRKRPPKKHISGCWDDQHIATHCFIFSQWIPAYLFHILGSFGEFMDLDCDFASTFYNSPSLNSNMCPLVTVLCFLWQLQREAEGIHYVFRKLNLHQD